MRRADFIASPWTPAHPRLASRFLRLDDARFSLRSALVFLAATLCLSAAEGTGASATSVRGLPFTRFYPFEEIGAISRGAKLTFDQFGRVAVVKDSALIALNDTTWIECAERAEAGKAGMSTIIWDEETKSYYFAALGSWGVAEQNREGRLRPRPFTPVDSPKWTQTTNFSEIAVTRRTACFAGWGGIVCVDLASGRHTYIEQPDTTRLFTLGDRIFASVHVDGIQEIDTAAGGLRPITGTEIDHVAVARVANLDPGHELVATPEGMLYVFDGANVARWKPQTTYGFTQRVTALERLAEGGVAVALSGEGVRLISDRGEMICSLTNSEYQRVTALAAREPGVLWVETENGVEKVLYGAPVTIFGQRLGLPASWPQMCVWKDRILVATGGVLYTSIPAEPGAANRFEPVPNQPAGGAWGVAASGDDLLVGNPRGVFVRGSDGAFSLVTSLLDAPRIVMANPDLCFVINATEIAALRRTDGHWAECAPRVPAAGYPSIVHSANNSAWVELGPNRVSHAWLQNGRIMTRVLESFPWKDAHWVNIGFLGDVVVLSGAPGERLYYSATTEEFCSAPEVDRLLSQAPYWVIRARQDERGTIWASYENGVMALANDRRDHGFDTTTFDIINDRFPFVQLLGPGEVWAMSGQSLYRIDPRVADNAPLKTLSPVLVSVKDRGSNAEVLAASSPRAPQRKFSYAENNLTFRFFSGSYTSRRSPLYEFRLTPGDENWTPVGADSAVNFSNLREGRYRLEVRASKNRSSAGPTTPFDFEVAPPWYRTSYAYALYLLGAGGLIVGFARWFGRRAHARNRELEKLVAERTAELKVTMQQLKDETRNAATLAERNRLAGEIHDSLQQGLTGLMLQIDATLKLPGLSPDVRSRLNVARNMVSFTRHEVQHAVWDMESPLFAGTELGEALSKIVGLINPGAVRIDVHVSGVPIPLSSTTKHHLLRIAQEAITNAVRHAKAQTIKVQLEYQGDAIALSVTDDGQGFDADSVLATGIGHFGLRGLRERAAKIDGELRIQSAPGAGASVMITVPLRSELHAAG